MSVRFASAARLASSPLAARDAPRRSARRGVWLAAAGDELEHQAGGGDLGLAQAHLDGVALTSSALVTDDIAAGRLIRPFDLSLPLDFGYYLLGPETTVDHPKVAAFRDWILAATG